MLTLSSLLLLATLTAADSHRDANPVYRQLLETGVILTEDVHEPLPQPSMPDRLSGAEQRATLEEINAGAYPLAQLLRKSVVARHILRLQQREEGLAPFRRADALFVAYGDLDAISDRDLLERMLSTEEDEGTVGDSEGSISPSELAARDVALVTDDEEHEGFANGTYELVNRVELQATIHWCWSRSEDSVVVAGRLDPRFEADDDYPNLWRAIERTETGAAQLGEPHPYSGMGFYIKITRMDEPEGALFVESHTVFSEPQGWFDGTNLLGSKLPAVVQRQVRSIRRELVKAARDLGN